MKFKSSLALILMLFLVACSGGRNTAPTNIDNACAMKREKPRWFRDLAKVERKYGVPPEIILATIHQESRFVARARTPMQYKAGIIPVGRKSSAYGFPQAIDSTWGWYKSKAGRSNAKRHNWRDAVDFVGWYMNESQKRNGISKRDAYNQYLAYHQGHTGYKRGSYRSKGWLLDVAQKVDARAARYGRQLRSCR